MLTEYSEQLQEEADKVTEEVAKDFAAQLEKVTPRSQEIGEHMADTVKVTAKDQRSLGRKTRVRYVHYGKYHIAHLLEFGWTAKDGKRITRQPFIRPLFDRNKDRYFEMYKRRLQK